ncbi:MAG: aminotransferase class I/II-fold pyridoxal phosphate-dependent enzyme [Bacteroidia bacterium]|nr:aminotransferase class I/II-fold pyridoxal phosphate-dependent enzyme [Bacteroidia bacterium]NNM23436.1 aminotransferase class I/II-fold pyridoxal phosphate-dependent enzyme [Flavobacteriaceae bacterium]
MIDLRSDTVTKPTSGMLEFISNAQVGDDVYGEDPTVNELQRRVAELFGMDRALFFPTGTMANQAAVKLHTQPGEQLICHEYSHVYNYEGGGVSFNSGVSCKLIGGDRGMITASEVEQAINPPDFYHSPLTSLVCVENTTNKGGGACYELDELQRIRDLCDRQGLRYHLDGARIMNALVAKNEDPTRYGRIFDTISVCFSKGLGAPLGTVLAGKQEVMEKAMRIRKVLGGGMRQIGYMAAAGLYALDHHIERLAEDHQRALEIALVLKGQSYVKEVEPTETNIVIFYLDDHIDETKFMKDLEQKNVKIGSMGQGKLRMVTHLDYSQDMHETLLELLGDYGA